MRQERHLVGARDDDPRRLRDRGDRLLDIRRRRLARGLLDVCVVRGDRGLEVAALD